MAGNSGAAMWRGAGRAEPATHAPTPSSCDTTRALEKEVAGRGRGTRGRLLLLNLFISDDNGRQTDRHSNGRTVKNKRESKLSTHTKDR